MAGAAPVLADGQPATAGVPADHLRAYGVTPDADDPLSKALHGLINQTATQEAQLQRILAALQAAGIACDKLADLDRFDPDQLNRLVE